MSLHLNAPDTLHDIHAVADTLYRFAAGMDLRDRKLLLSAFTEDAISDFRPAGAKAGFEYPVSLFNMLYSVSGFSSRTWCRTLALPAVHQSCGLLHCGERHI